MNTSLLVKSSTFLSELANCTSIWNWNVIKRRQANACKGKQMRNSQSKTTKGHIVDLVVFSIQFQDVAFFVIRTTKKERKKESFVLATKDPDWVMSVSHSGRETKMKTKQSDEKNENG